MHAQEPTVNGEEMYQTPLCIGKNNNPYLKKNLAHNKLNWKFCDFTWEKKTVSALENYVKVGAVSTACVACKNIFTPLTFCSAFFASLDFPKAANQDFLSETNSKYSTLKKKKKKGNCWILCFFLWLEHEVLNIWWQQHIWKKKEVGTGAMKGWNSKWC